METPNTTERLKQLLPQLFERDRATGERYLTFEITPSLKAAIPLSLLWEAAILPAVTITPIPQMSPYVLGWHNGRDRVYCVISLAEFLGLASTSEKLRFQKYPTLIVQVPSSQPTITGQNQSLLLGLTVSRILRTVTVTPEAHTDRVDGFPAALTPYLQGTLNQEKPQAVLNLTAITDQIR
ncbi:MAG: chemotaxis protein CheW [Halothece sp.]